MPRARAKPRYQLFFINNASRRGKNRKPSLKVAQGGVEEVKRNGSGLKRRVKSSSAFFFASVSNYLKTQRVNKEDELKHVHTQIYLHHLASV